jgi:nicotinamide-nucleotide amidase
VGTVVLALVAPGVEQVQRFRFTGDRSQIRLMTACTALEWIRRLAITRLNDGAL